MVTLDVNVDLTLEIDGEEKVVRMSLAEAKELHRKLGAALGQVQVPVTIPAPYPVPYPVPSPYTLPWRNPWIGQPMWSANSDTKIGGVLSGGTITNRVKDVNVSFTDAPALTP